MADNHTEELLTIAYRLFRYDEMFTADISCEPKESTIAYLAGRQYALQMTESEWTKYHSLKSNKEILAYDQEKMCVMLKMSYYNPIEDDYLVKCFECGIYKGGSEIGKYPKMK